MRLFRLISILILSILAACGLFACGGSSGGAAGGADTTSPTDPANLASIANKADMSFTLSWDVSTDNVGVTGYRMYKRTYDAGSILLTNTIVNTPANEFTGFLNGTDTGGYFAVQAYDLANNLSAETAELPVFMNVTAPVLVSLSPPAISESNISSNTGITLIGNFIETGFVNVSFNGTQTVFAETGCTNLRTPAYPLENCTDLDITADTSGLSVGSYVVNAATADGNSALNFYIATTPTISDVSPTSGCDDSPSVLTITGTGFIPPATVKATKSGGGDYFADSVVYTDSTEIEATFSIPLTNGTYDITVISTPGNDATAVASYQVDSC